jgi:hypothetical protein
MLDVPMYRRCTDVPDSLFRQPISHFQDTIPRKQSTVAGTFAEGIDPASSTLRSASWEDIGWIHEKQRSQLATEHPKVRGLTPARKMHLLASPILGP